MAKKALSYLTVRRKIDRNFCFRGIFQRSKRTFNVAKLFYRMRNSKAHPLKLFRSSGFGEKSPKQFENQKICGNCQPKCPKSDKKSLQSPTISRVCIEISVGQRSDFMSPLLLTWVRIPGLIGSHNGQYLAKLGPISAKISAIPHFTQGKSTRTFFSKTVFDDLRAKKHLLLAIETIL